MRDYRARLKDPKPQSVDLEKCVSIEDRDVSKVVYDQWAAGRQMEFFIREEEVA